MAAAGCAAISCGLAALGNYFYRKVLRADGPLNIENEDVQEQAWDMPSVWMQGHGGLKLSAYCQKGAPENHKWAICIHGYKSHPRRMEVYAEHYLEKGMHVLLPSLQGHGDSEGAYIGMGWEDRLTVLNWIDWILKRDPAAEIVLHGVSMGAATALMTAGEPLPDAVRAVISDCGYTTALDEFKYVLKEDYGTVLYPSLPALEAVTRKRAGYRLKDASAIDAVGRASVPILFIHGLDDDFVPPYIWQKNCMQRKKQGIESCIWYLAQATPIRCM